MNKKFQRNPKVVLTVGDLKSECDSVRALFGYGILRWYTPYISFIVLCLHILL